MAVFKRGKTYWYEFVWRSERIRESTRQGNANVARDMAAAHRTRLAKGEVGIQERRKVPTLKAFSNTFLAYVDVEHADRARTIKFYGVHVRALLRFPRLANARLDRIDLEMIDAYKQWKSRQVSRSGRPYKRSTIGRDLAVLRRLLGYAKQMRQITDVPEVRQFKLPAPRDFIISREQEPLYLAAAAGDYHDFAVLLLDAGLRPGEGLSLEWSQVRFRPEPGYVTVTGDKAKGARERSIPLTPRLREVLKARRQKHGYVFHRDGKPLKAHWLQDEHEKVRKLLKLPQFVPHSLRHTFGTRLSEAGVDAFTIKYLMGHSTVTVTERYVHTPADAAARAIERLADAGEKVPGVPTKSTTPKKGRTRKSLIN